MVSKAPNRKRAWWKEASVYQIYPASFMDTNDDGWGDVPGIISKLDYLQNLGVDVLWLSPIFKSPQVDMGYDISDYKKIDPRYGTLEDVDELISEGKRRNLRILMDLVVNHTSDQHDWFKESRSSISSPKRSWYIWKPPKYSSEGTREPPNNWAMLLHEDRSAWTWDEKTGEYYLSLFTSEQPDLNWENEEVREAVHDVMTFWLKRGASGFRMDVINHISKVQTFPDAPLTRPDHKYQPGNDFFANGPRLHEFLVEMNRKVLSKFDAMTVGEMPYAKDYKEILRCVGADEEELNMIFIFDIVEMDSEPGQRMTLREWDARDLKKILGKWQRVMIDNNGWNSLFVENHDTGRSVTRYTNDDLEYHDLGSKLLCLMNTTLCGTPYVYQGEEIGMRNFPISWDISEYKDVQSQSYWNEMVRKYPHDKRKLDFARKVLAIKARDHARTPVQWNSAPHGGFCKPQVEPWMRANDDYKIINTEIQLNDSSKPHGMSIFHFWQRGLENRKKHKEVFVYGDFELLNEEHKQIFSYLRTSQSDGNWIVALNFSKDEAEWLIPDNITVKAWAAGNYTADKPDKSLSGSIILRPFEGLLGMCA